MIIYIYTCTYIYMYICMYAYSAGPRGRDANIVWPIGLMRVYITHGNHTVAATRMVVIHGRDAWQALALLAPWVAT